MKTIIRVVLCVCLMASLSAGAQAKKAHTATGTIKPANSAAKKGGSFANSKVMTEEEFLKNFPEVKGITWAPGSVVTLEKADGSKEQYTIDRFDDEKKFVAAYGRILRQSQPATRNN